MIISGFAASSSVVLKHDHIEVLSYLKMHAKQLASQGTVDSLDEFTAVLQEKLRPLGDFVIEVYDSDGAQIETLLEGTDGVTLWVTTEEPDPLIH